MKNKKIYFYSFMIMITVVIIELVSMLTIYFLTESKSDQRLAEEIDGLRFVFEERASELYKSPHPYFGFTMKSKNHERAPVNNYGFQSTYDFPYVKKENELVIGIFGGSVADLFAYYVSKNNNSQLVSKIEEKTGKKVVILNLALPSGKQPQQFYIASYFLPTFDFVITIDGFNEIWHNIPGVYPQEFPAWSEFLFPLRPEYLKNLSKIAFLKDYYESLNRWKRSFRPLSWSFSYRLVLLATHRLIMEKWHELSHFNEDFNGGNSYRFTSKTASVEEVVSYNAKTWMRYTQQLHQLLKANNISYSFYIQPNQHVPGSKPLSQKEKDDFINPNWTKTVALGYVELGKRNAELLKAGVDVHNLQNIFKDQKETLYLDDCCHFSDIGNAIIEKVVIEDVIKKL